VIATFFEAERARDYADRENSRSAEHTVELTEAPTRPAVEPPAAASELSARQSAVLGVLRSKMDANKQVEAKAAVLAEAANIPLGSLHSVLQSLEKKRLITTVRAGSARAPAVYQVL
jgi:DNA-binding MarR family transcriptional regulator